MLILEHFKQRKKCRGLNGVGYCPFPILGRDTAVVSRQEGPCEHDRRSSTHNSNSAHDSSSAYDSTSAQHGAWCTTEGLCCDRGVYVMIGDGGFHVATWSTMSRHGPSARVGGCVLISIIMS